MHLLTNHQPIPMGGNHGMLDPGEWLCDDVNAAQLLLMGQRGTSKIVAQGFRLIQSGDGMLVIRSGAIGDLLYLSPALALLRATIPGRLALACFPKHHELMRGVAGIELLPYPVSLDKAKEFALVHSLENVMELNPGEHATDAFAQALGVAVENYKPVFGLTLAERVAAQACYPKISRLRIGIQPMASVANRTYPLPYWLKVIEDLTRNRNCEVFVFGHKGQVPPLPQNLDYVTNLTIAGPSLIESAAILATCDVFCGVDSALLPLCHALDIPAVGLYAAFDWKTRTSKAPMTWALTGVGECAPCSWHQHAGSPFPPDKPCARLGNCHVLAGITPERIVAKILSLPRHASA